MADIIKCPVCGESNLPDQEFCQYCQSRLQPLTGNLKGADAPIKPGQMPTKKNTAELEPILPQWLRDARDSARKSAEDDAAQAGRQPNESYSSAAPSSDDLLAGLHSQAGNEEEETPDWLANITGAAPKPKKPQADSPEVRWVELGGAKDFAQEEPKAAEPEPFMPSWLEGLTPTEPQRDEKDELTDWFRQTDDSQKSQQPESQPPAFDTSFSEQAEQPVSDDTPDWLKKMAADSAQSNDALFSDSEKSTNTFNAPSSDTPDWLRQMAADAGEPANDLNATPSDTSDAPDWLHQMVADDGIQNENIQTLSAGTFDAPEQKTDDAPDWLRAMGTLQDETPSADSAGFSETGAGESEAAVSSNEDVPDWMKSFPPVESEKPSQSTTPSWLKEEKPASSAETEVPAWLSATPEPEQQQPPATEPEFGDIPSWLKASAPQSSIYEDPSAESTPEPASSSSESPDWLQAFKALDNTGSQPSTEFPSEVSPESTSASESPDWLNAFKALDTTGSQPSTQFPSDTPFEAAPPAFTPDSQASENLDALFTDMPDWLSSTSDASSSANPPSTPPTPTTPTEGLTPGELPSWVQAMRPVDTGNSLRASLVAGLAGDQTLESRGALAGLQGVLPSVPGYAPTSKPKAYSIKLQASEEQQAHATLLEQILSAETEPVPIASFSALTTSRGLRWFLSAAVFVVLILAFFLPTHLFPLPVGMPFEIGGAVQVSKSIPQGAPVLVAFDYEPARAGEMEAAAAPLFNLLDQPNLTLVSTNETGSILAERFISGLSVDPAEESGLQPLNLGYLPGGQMGIRALAQDPARTFSALQGISSLSQFTALIIITDSADSARMWIEQTSSAGGKTPIVIISSAQAAPMIQPYYDSQQISGLVSGLYGGAVLENSGGTSGAAQTYWDAYSVGMLLAVAVITGGALWSFILGMRNRAATGETK